MGTAASCTQGRLPVSSSTGEPRKQHGYPCGLCRTSGEGRMNPPSSLPSPALQSPRRDDTLQACPSLGPARPVCPALQGRPPPPPAALTGHLSPPCPQNKLRAGGDTGRPCQCPCGTERANPHPGRAEATLGPPETARLAGFVSPPSPGRQCELCLQEGGQPPPRGDGGHPSSPWMAPVLVGRAFGARKLASFWSTGQFPVGLGGF